MNTETIKIIEGDEYLCVCGNTPLSDGFDATDRWGNLVDPNPVWKGHYRCNCCNRVFDSTDSDLTVINSDLIRDRGVNYRYSMFTMAGNNELARRVGLIAAACNNGQITRRDLPEEVKLMLQDLAATHSECYDTEPQEQIAYELNEQACGPCMWQPISRWEW